MKIDIGQTIDPAAGAAPASCTTLLAVPPIP